MHAQRTEQRLRQALPFQLRQIHQVTHHHRLASKTMQLKLTSQATLSKPANGILNASISISCNSRRKLAIQSGFMKSRIESAS
ncbi:hypothetical protein Nepgr_005262 [Nepenthes gracilis]|uniref:Uncharacterized protein n=1 Tax=Nepenthes gracilis TaxID=150966 RepID=A0AAD3S2V1_NEPGR|nr:hypothetical protein Nepgr_005262 [Nepenthes gracilis]